MVRLRRIPAIRAANLLSLTIGIPYGILLLVFSLFFGVFWMSSSSGGSAFVGLTTLANAFILWVWAMVVLWIFVALACALYNLIAGRMGGIELEFQTIPPGD